MVPEGDALPGLHVLDLTPPWSLRAAIDPQPDNE